MKPGRIAKPAGQRGLGPVSGTRAPNLQEPIPEMKSPACPKWLDGEAKKEYRFICKHLRRLGLAAEIDRSLVAAFAVNWAIFVEASQKVELLGQVVKGPKGVPMTNPFLTNMQKSVMQLLRLGLELGISGGSRTKLHAQAPQKDVRLTAEDRDRLDVHSDLFGDLTA